MWAWCAILSALAAAPITAPRIEGARLAGVDPATVDFPAQLVETYIGPPRDAEVRWPDGDDRRVLSLVDDEDRAIVVWACLAAGRAQCDLRTILAPQNVSERLRGKGTPQDAWLDEHFRWRDLATCCDAPEPGWLPSGAAPYLAVDARTGTCQEWRPRKGPSPLQPITHDSRDPGYDPHWRPPPEPDLSLRCPAPARHRPDEYALRASDRAATRPPTFRGLRSAQLLPRLDEQGRWIDLAACCDGVRGAPEPGQRLVVELDGRCHVADDVTRPPQQRGDLAPPARDRWTCPSIHPLARHRPLTDRGKVPWAHGGGYHFHAERDWWPVPQAWILGQLRDRWSFGAATGLVPVLVIAAETDGREQFVSAGSLALLGKARRSHSTTLYEDGSRTSMFRRGGGGQQYIRPGVLAGWLRREGPDGFRLRPQVTAGRSLHLQVSVPVDIVERRVELGLQAGLAVGL